MSNQVLRITLDNDDPLINSKEVGQIVISADRSTVDFVGSDGEPEHIAVFDPSSSSNIYMEKADYDTNTSGALSVDNADNLGSIPANQYATKTWVTTNAVGDMTKGVYDTNNNGVVDNSERLGGQLPAYYASVSYVQTNFGDMRKSVYDTNDNGVIDNSEKLNNELPSYYLDYTNFTNKPNLLDWNDCNPFPLQIGDVITYSASGWKNTQVIDQGNF